MSDEVQVARRLLVELEQIEGVDGPDPDLASVLLTGLDAPQDVPNIAEALGPQLLGRLDRVLHALAGDPSKLDAGAVVEARDRLERFVADQPQ